LNLPEKVQRVPGTSLVDTKSLLDGDKFVFQGTVWTVLRVKADGIECKPDPTFFLYPQG
jgi:hypothetical protein